jgi:hypothetical protein
MKDGVKTENEGLLVQPICVLAAVFIFRLIIGPMENSFCFLLLLYYHYHYHYYFPKLSTFEEENYDLTH